jgi:hypothetical protein
MEHMIVMNANADTVPVKNINACVMGKGFSLQGNNTLSVSLL